VKVVSFVGNPRVFIKRKQTTNFLIACYSNH